MKAKSTKYVKKFEDNQREMGRKGRKVWATPDEHDDIQAMLKFIRSEGNHCVFLPKSRMLVFTTPAIGGVHACDKCRRLYLEEYSNTVKDGSFFDI